MKHYDLHVERALLGLIISEPMGLDTVLTMGVREDSFWLMAHRLIWKSLVRLKGAGTDIDLVTLQGDLQASDDLHAVKGIAYLSSLTESPDHPNSVKGYAVQLLEHARKRFVAERADELSQATKVADPEECERQLRTILSDVSNAISTIPGRDNPVERLGDSVVTEVMRLDQERDAPHEQRTRPFFRSGFYPWDNALGGIQKDRPTIIAARPGMGKTALGTQILAGLALREGLPCGMLSIEMSRQKLVQRVICCECQVDYGRYRQGLLTPEEYQTVYEFADKAYEMPVWVNYSGYVTIDRVEATVRQWRRQYGIVACLVDYVQLVETGRAADSEYRQVSLVAKAVRNLQKETGVAMILVAQLNREAEKRKDSRPIMSDLRGGGQLEQDAGCIAFLHREWMYMNEEKRRLNPEREEKAELIIAKNDGGKTGSVELAFHGPHYRFYEGALI